MAKKDETGKIETDPIKLKELYTRTYDKKLRNREMNEQLLYLYYLKMELWSLRMRELKSAKTSN